MHPRQQAAVACSAIGFFTWVDALVFLLEDAKVTVTEIEGGQTVVFELSVAKSDMGKVIGKKGRNALALRTILSAAAGKAKKRYVLEIVE